MTRIIGIELLHYIPEVFKRKALLASCYIISLTNVVLSLVPVVVVAIMFEEMQKSITMSCRDSQVEDDTYWPGIVPQLEEIRKVS